MNNNKSRKMKTASRKARKQTFKQYCKKIIMFPIRAIKWLWRQLCRICRAIWNWLKSIDIVGMINLTLLVAIIVLFSALINNVICCNKCDKNVAYIRKDAGATQIANKNVVDNRRVVKRQFSTVLPVKPISVDEDTTIRPQIRTIGVKKNELPKQVLGGDVIIERHPSSPVLSNGVRINGNLYIQNMNKYTIPCDAKINGHLFIRNVNKLKFCGKFTVNGNVYVNRESSFGALPDGTKINGQIIL